MLPQGFLGTRADILMDLVILSFIIILPTLVVSWRQVRQEKYNNHKVIQLTLSTILLIAVGLFEVNLKISGGIFELTKESAYAGTFTLNAWIISHTIAAILTTLIWIILIFLSLKKFDKPPVPNTFSDIHKLLGKVGMLGMIFTGISSFPLYYYGFAL